MTLQLYRDYETILRNHRVKIRPAAIRLFDSTSYWGKWDSETRTIFISRKLVEEHPWFYVESILRHEMAHQYAMEVLCDHHHPASPPHGEAFLRGCERLGVPEEFSGATCHLRQTELDWKKQPVSSEAGNLLAKVRKLLALATSSNEHEALLAMNKVRELYAKYNIDQNALYGAQRSSERGFVHLILCHGKKRIEAHQDKTVGILVGHFFVKAVFGHQFDPSSGRTHRAIEIVGTRENVLMAEYVYHFLLQQTELLLSELKQKSGGKISRVQANSFRLGVLEGFRKKLEKTDEEQQAPLRAGTHPSVIGQALALHRGGAEIATYLSKVYPRLSWSTSGGRLVDPSSYSAGKAAGAKIVLQKVVSSEAAPSGRFLPSGRA